MEKAMVAGPPGDALPGGELAEADHPLTAPPPPTQPPPPAPIRLMIRANEAGTFEAFQAPASPTADESDNAELGGNEDIEQMRRVDDSVSQNGSIV